MRRIRDIEVAFFMRAFWLVGFRPFFTLAMLSGMVMPVLWALVYADILPAPLTSFSSVQWHAHEMFFGFGLAMLVGFLLTATKNWVGVRGYHGLPLQLMAVFWLLERLGMWFQQALPGWAFLLANNLFEVSAAVMLMRTLISHRKTDSYADNFYFLLLLPLLPLAKALLLDESLTLIGQSMAMGLFRLAFLIMLERTLTQFMKGVFQAAILRHPLLDRAIKGLALLFVFEGLMPPALSSVAAFLLAVLLALRLVFWKPHLALRRLEIGIMYLGYLAMTIHLVLLGVNALLPLDLTGAAIAHIFTLGAIGLITPAMIVRIAKGHTGRKVAFEMPDKMALWLMILAFVARIAAPQVWPGAYLAWIGLAAACWFACFAILAVRYVPFLLAPRLDGRVH